jgi:hypothetical protein
MLARVARAALFLTTMLVVSTLTRSAFAAAAPFCDDRGATALAAPPVLVAPEAALQRARAGACGDQSDGDRWMAALRQARQLSSDVSAPPDGPGPAGLGPRLVQVPLASSSMFRRSEVAGQPATGARLRVERPPRG